MNDTTSSLTITDHPYYQELLFSSPKANCLTTPLILQLTKAFIRVSTNPKIKFIYLKSEGSQTFCAGASLDELKQFPTAKSAIRYFLQLSDLFLAMLTCKKIILLSVQGKAVGGAVGLIAASDYVIAKDSAALKLSELQVGLAPFVIGPLIEKKIGVSHLANLSLSTDWFSAGWGKDVGLYSELYNDVLTSSASSEVSDFDSLVAAKLDKFSGFDEQTLSLWKERLWFCGGTSKSYWKRVLYSGARLSGNSVYKRAPF